MIKVELIAKTDIEPKVLSSHAAKTCYTSNVPELGSLIDVENRLFKPGHHTTLQHNYFTFNIDNISVSSICFGFHLASPFYNSDQRSGRFSKMYENPDISEIANYLRYYYPSEDIYAAIVFIIKGIKIYADNKEKLTKLAVNFIKKERPYSNEKYINQNAPKFAQEQLRMFISQIALTSFDFTINISSLAALYRVAWNPEMRDTVNKMVEKVLEFYPDMAYMFLKDAGSKTDWHPEFKLSKIGLKEKPELELLYMNFDKNKFCPNNFANDTVDILYFSPMSMENTQMNVKTYVEVSSATMGQDQRHRTIKRSAPIFTGNFYLPPLLKEAGMENIALEYMEDYANLTKKISPILATAIAPYGAMIGYYKNADLNALMHEQGKRTCWCAQEEIYHLSTKLREKLIEKLGYDSPIFSELTPPCFVNKKCCEGVRYCGRDILNTPTQEYFKYRKI